MAERTHGGWVAFHQGGWQLIYVRDSETTSIDISDWSRTVSPYLMVMKGLEPPAKGERHAVRYTANFGATGLIRHLHRVWLPSEPASMAFYINSRQVELFYINGAYYGIGIDARNAVKRAHHLVGSLGTGSDWYFQ